MNVLDEAIDILDQQPVNNQATEGIMGSNLARPQGRKSAKSDEAAKRRTEKKRKSYATSAAEVVIDVDNKEEVESNKLIAESIAMLSPTISSNSFFDKLERSIRHYTDLGMTVMAALKMEELQAYLEKEKQKQDQPATPCIPAAGAEVIEITHDETSRAQLLLTATSLTATSMGLSLTSEEESGDEDDMEEEASDGEDDKVTVVEVRVVTPPEEEVPDEEDDEEYGDVDELQTHV